MTTRLPAHRRVCGGFTLLETMFAVSLMSLIFLGTMGLYLTAVRTAARTTVETQATQDAAMGMQHVLHDAREALWFTLPSDTNNDFMPPPGYVKSDFQAFATGRPTVDTCVQIAFPRLPAAPTAFFNAVGRPVSATLFDRSTPATGTLWVYRADKNGVPNKTAGKYLWATGSEMGQTVNGPFARMLLTTAYNAVQFSRPTDSGGAVVPYQLEVKLVSGDYSPINGNQSNEATDGAGVTILDGKCAWMRNRETGLAHQPTVAP